MTMQCDWCGAEVTHLPQGWKEGEPAYCQTHRLIRGRDPLRVADLAIREAMFEQDTDTSTLIRWPWPSLHRVAGFLLPGSVTYVAAFPSNGKTSFASRAIRSWSLDGFRQYVMPTEARPKHLMTRLAAAAVDVDADEAISMRLKAREDAGDPYAKQDRARLMAEFERIQSSMREEGPPVFIEPTPRLTHTAFRDACKAANAMGCDIIIVDHIDHVGGDKASNMNSYAVSEAVQHDALEFAQAFNLPILLMSQLNSKATGGDRLAPYKNPSTDWLWMKGVKDQVAATILGLHRVLDPNADERQLGKVRQGLAKPQTVALAGRMGVGLMKGRHAGQAMGDVVQLKYERGALSELDDTERREVEADEAGVSTRPWWEEAV